MPGHETGFAMIYGVASLAFMPWLPMKTTNAFITPQWDALGQHAFARALFMFGEMVEIFPFVIFFAATFLIPIRLRKFWPYSVTACHRDDSSKSLAADTGAEVTHLLDDRQGKSFK